MSYTNNNKYLQKESLKIEIHVNNGDEIEFVAKKYSNNDEEYKFIIKYLTKKLLQSSQDIAIIPLENILSPFIRKKIGTFDPKGGPNCYNAGLCVNQSHQFNVGYTSPEDLLHELSKSYIQIKERDLLKIGDLILYLNTDDTLAHVAAYIDEDIVFTKNGINKFNPYIFQRQKALEEVYFGVREFKKKYYRPKLNAL